MALFVATDAHATVIDIDARDRNNAVTVQLAAGSYMLTPLAAGVDGARFTAFSYWRGNGQCAGDLCDTGFNWRVVAEGDELARTRLGFDGARWRTQELALANAGSFELTLAVADNVRFFIGDSRFGDNRGGVSFRIDPVLAFDALEEAQVPAPAMALLLLAGAAWLGAGRRA